MKGFWEYVSISERSLFDFKFGLNRILVSATPVYLYFGKGFSKVILRFGFVEELELSSLTWRIFWMTC